MGIVAQLQNAHAPQLDGHNLAIAELWRHRWENRANALANTIEHLVVNHDMPEATAEITAIQAYADVEAASQTARIDMNATTSHVVVLRTEGGRPVVFTVSDLLRVLEQARADGRAKVVDRNTRRPVVLEH